MCLGLPTDMHHMLMVDIMLLPPPSPTEHRLGLGL